MDDITQRRKKKILERKRENVRLKKIYVMLFISRVYFIPLIFFFHHQNAIFVLFYRFKKQDTFKMRIKIANVTYLEYDNFLISYYKNSVLQT